MRLIRCFPPGWRCGPDPAQGRLHSALMIAFACWIGSGCATAEPRYAAQQLPATLRATVWQSPCAVDLSSALSGQGASAVERVSANGSDSSETARCTVSDDSPPAWSEKTRVELAVPHPAVRRITVTGAVQHPGIFDLPRYECDLVSALAAAGGLSRDAGPHLIIQGRDKVRHHAPVDVEQSKAGPPQDNAPERREIQLTSATAPLLAREQLKDGDVVVVERRDPPSIVVSGLVQKPGRYELPVGQEYRVLDAVANAQGVSYKVLDTLVVCRELPGESRRAVIQVSLREATRNQDENIVLMPGDIVSVETNARLLAQDVASYVGLATVALGSFFIHF